MEKNTKLKNELIEIFSCQEGVSGFALAKTNNQPPQKLVKNLSQGLKIEKGLNGLIINVHIILAINANAEQVSKSILKSAKSVCSKSSKKLESINVYIRGVC